jgi:hypothetical protein
MQDANPPSTPTKSQKLIMAEGKDGRGVGELLRLSSQITVGHKGNVIRMIIHFSMKPIYLHQI